MQNITAWLTTDPGRLAGPLADITVLDIGPETGACRQVLAEIVTDVDVTDDDALAGVQEAAERFLTDHGWKLTGPWELVDSGAVGTVAKQS